MSYQTKKAVIYIALGLTAMLLVLLYFMGVFLPVRFQSKQLGPFYYLYLPHQGPYRDVRQSFQKLTESLTGTPFAEMPRAGIYYDDPEKIPQTRLRSRVAVLLSETDSAQAKELSQKTELRFGVIPRQKFVTTQFPLRNDLSILLGILKVYPALKEYMKSHNWPEYTYKEIDYENSFIMEIYRKGQIEYILPFPEEESERL